MKMLFPEQFNSYFIKNPNQKLCKNGKSAFFCQYLHFLCDTCHFDIFLSCFKLVTFDIEYRNGLSQTFN